MFNTFSEFIESMRKDKEKWLVLPLEIKDQVKFLNSDDIIALHREQRKITKELIQDFLEEDDD